MAKNPKLKAKEAHTDLMHQKDRLEKNAKTLHDKINHIKERINEFKDWVRLGVKAQQCSPDVAKRLSAPELKKIVHLKKELELYTKQEAQTQNMLKLVDKTEKTLQKTENNVFRSSLITSDEVKDLLEKLKELNHKNTSSARAEAKVIAHIFNAIKEIKGPDDISGMAKVLTQIEKGEMLLSSSQKSNRVSFFSSPKTTSIESTKELKALKECLKDKIEEAMESRVSFKR